MKKLALVALGIALGIGGTVLAANKTATLVPPADYTGGGWSIMLTPMAGAGQTATNWCANVTFIAKDGVTGAQDGVSYQTCTTTPPAAITNFANTMLSAAKAANGY